MAQNQFLTFATDSGANVMSQSDYASLTARTAGFQSGIAKSAQYNKAFRQACFVAAALSQFVADNQGTDVLDNGDQGAWESQLEAAILSYIKPFYIPITPATTFYVDFALGNDSNPGTSAGSGAFRTLQGAYTAISQYFANNITISVAAGTYTAPAGSIAALWISPTLVANWNIVGAGAGATIINCTASGVRGFMAFGGETMYVSGFTVSANKECFAAVVAGQIFVRDVAIATGGSVSIGFAAAAGGRCFVAGNISFTGVFEAAFDAHTGGLIDLGWPPYVPQLGGLAGTPVTIQMIATPSFAACASAAECGTLQVAPFVSVTITGNATGARYAVSVNGNINTNGGGANFFPGSSAGSTATGGVYV